jgi:hypothetical protein
MMWKNETSFQDLLSDVSTAAVQVFAPLNEYEVQQ